MMINRRPPKKASYGFTLLEVLIALTITALVLGGLFTLAAGSKQLAVRTQDSLHDAVSTRAAINLASLDDQLRGLQPLDSNNTYRINSSDLLEDPPRRTAPMTDLLERFEIERNNSGETVEGVRWVRSELPR